MKVLVTGAAGLLGAEVVPNLDRAHDVVPCDIDDFDVADIDAFVGAVLEVRPDAVVHLAAFSDVDGAEEQDLAAFRVNGIGAKNAALASREVGARLIHISTDYVFDGTSTEPYLESDPVGPLGVYARSKWMGESAVRELGETATVVRTQALYGNTGGSFVSAILSRIERGEPLEVVTDQTTCPTRAADLAVAIRHILENGGPGVYHASANGECTWFEAAREIARLAGAPDHPIRPITTAELARPAPRPAYGVLRNLHLELTIGDTLPHWKEALGLHFESANGGG